MNGCVNKSRLLPVQDGNLALCGHWPCARRTAATSPKRPRVFSLRSLAEFSSPQGRKNLRYSAVRLAAVPPYRSNVSYPLALPDACPSSRHAEEISSMNRRIRRFTKRISEWMRSMDDSGILHSGRTARNLPAAQASLATKSGKRAMPKPRHVASRRNFPLFELSAGWNSITCTPFLAANSHFARRAGP